MSARSLNLANERGAVQFYMVCAAAALAGLLLMVVNTGTHTMKKVELQNTTDAAVYSGATWISRGLNVISLSNVIQANLLAIAFSIPAFDKAMGVAVIILYAEAAVCTALTLGVGAVACNLIKLAGDAMNKFRMSGPFRKVVSTATAPNGKLWDIMRKLGDEAELVRKLTPVLAEAEVFRIATADGKARGALIVARSESGGLTLLPTIPAKRGTFQDLCDATRRPLYPSSKSPIDTVTDVLIDNPIVFAYNFLTGIRYIFRGFLAAQYAQYCNGPRSSTEVPTPVDSFAQCEAGGGEARWAAGTFNFPLRPTYVEAARDLDNNGPSEQSERVSYRTFTQDCSWRPPGEPAGSPRKYKTGYVSTVGSSNAPAYRAVVTFYEAVLLSVSREAEADPAPGGEGWKPLPVVLIDDGSDRSTRGARARLEYLAIAMSYPTTRVGGQVWESPLGVNTFGYGQAKSFNPTTFDLFTQNWQAKLVPASALENGMLGGSLDGGNASRDASALGFLRGLHFNEFLRWLNNH